MESNDAETVPDDLLETLLQYAEFPINLNDTTNELLLDLPFISDFQYNAIRAYIAQNGELFSLSELHAINGFDSLTIARLSHFVKVEQVDYKEDVPLVELLRRGRGSLTTGLRTIFPRQRGYTEGKYAGGPYRYYYVFNYKCSDRISFSFSADQDAGEPFVFQSPVKFGSNSGQVGFDYYGYSLILRDLGIIKKAVIGKYHLQYGQGLTLWAGYAPWLSETASLRRSPMGIKAASALCEYGYLHGAAIAVDLWNRGNRNVEMTLFASNAPRAATLVHEGSDMVFSLYNSGYFRTENERAKRNALRETLLGTRLSFNSRDLRMGVTAFSTSFSKTIIPPEYVYNAFAFRGERLFNGGYDFSYRWRNMIFFGEAALSMDMEDDASAQRAFAVLAGLQMDAGPDNFFSAVFHHCPQQYHNFFFNTVGTGSSQSNETGMAFNLLIRLPFSISLSGYADLYRHPWMMYRVYSPSVGADCKVALDYMASPNISARIQYRQRDIQRNTNGITYYIEDMSCRQLLVSLKYKISDRWNMLSKIIGSRVVYQDGQMESGFVMLQDVSYSSQFFERPFFAVMRLSISDISSYDARIYSYESDMVYESSSFSFIGRGVRVYGIVRMDVTRNISLSIKYGLLLLPGNKSIGSSYDLIEGPMRHDVKIQLKWKF